MEPWKLEPARDHGLPLGERLRSLKREAGLLESAAHQGWWTLVHTYLRLCHRFKVRGRRNLPKKPPYVLVANHASHLDALVMAAPMPWYLRDRVFPIAAGDTFFETPMVSAFAALVLNALPMWRKKCGAHALEQLRERLVQEPATYILFPEGTRTRDGNMGRFKPGIGMIVAETNVPVVPCYLDGTFASMPPHCNWPRFRQIVLKIGPPITFTAKNHPHGWKEIAKETEAVVRQLGGVTAT